MHISSGLRTMWINRNGFPSHVTTPLNLLHHSDWSTGSKAGQLIGICDTLILPNVKKLTPGTKRVNQLINLNAPC